MGAIFSANPGCNPHTYMWTPELSGVSLPLFNEHLPLSIVQKKKKQLQDGGRNMTDFLTSILKKKYGQCSEVNAHEQRERKPLMVDP